jgi:hypothetical protein
MTPHPTPVYLEGIIPTKIEVGHYIVMTLTKAVQLEFGRGPLSSLQRLVELQLLH